MRSNWNPIHGLVAATFTPLQTDGSLDLDAIPEVCESVLAQGADGLFLCGSTGEGPSLTVEERIQVSEAYLQAAAGRVPVIVQVGHESLQSARRLANHAEGAGADAISLVPPAYFRTSSMETLVAGLAYVGEAAPSLPLYYYHVPRLSGANFRVLDLLQEVKDKVPSFVGVKFSAFEMDDLLRCIAFEDGLFDILFGSDEMLLAGMAMGAKGAVGSTYNFLGPYYHRVIEAFEAGRVDEARQHQHAVTCLVHTILRHGGHPALKAAMGILGKDCGPCRLPISTLTPHAVEALAGDLHGALHRAGDLPLGLKAKTRFRNV